MAEIKTLESAELREMDGKLDKARQELHEVYEQAGEDLDPKKVKAITVANGSELRDWVKSQDAKINDLKEKREEIASALRAIAENEKALTEPAETFTLPGPGGKKGAKPGDGEMMKRSVADLVLAKLWGEDGKFKGEYNRDIEVDMPSEKAAEVLKTVMSTGAGWDPEDIRLSRVSFSATRPAPVVADLFPVFPFSQSTVKYMSETTYTNNAAETAESVQGTPGNLPESALAFTEVSDEVRKIGHTLPVTDEQLEDVPQLRGIIDQRLRLMVQQRFDLQLLVGDGSAPNISGIHDRSNLQTQAKGSDNDVDAFYKAITNCRVNAFAEPDAVVIHPTDWQEIRLLTTADGIYLFGPPSQMGAETLWGLPVTATTAETVTQGLVGAFQAHAAIYLRRGIEVAVTDSHASEFIADIMRLKMTMRAALAVFREAAFCEVTGL